MGRSREEGREAAFLLGFGHPRGDVRGKGAVVRDEEHRAVERPERVAQVLSRAQVEVVGRLVLHAEGGAASYAGLACFRVSCPLSKTR